MKLPYQEWYETIDKMGKVKVRKLRPTNISHRKKVKATKKKVTKQPASVFEYMNKKGPE